MSEIEITQDDCRVADLMRLAADNMYRRREIAARHRIAALEAQAARIAELEDELDTWKSVFPDIAPDRVLPDRSLLEARIAKLEGALRKIASCEKRADGDVVDIARTALQRTGI